MSSVIGAQALLLQLLDTANRADPYSVYTQFRDRGPIQLPKANLTVTARFPSVRLGAEPRYKPNVTLRGMAALVCGLNDRRPTCRFGGIKVPSKIQAGVENSYIHTG